MHHNNQMKSFLNNHSYFHESLISIDTFETFTHFDCRKLTLNSLKLQVGIFFGIKLLQLKLFLPIVNITFLPSKYNPKIVYYLLDFIALEI